MAARLYVFASGQNEPAAVFDQTGDERAALTYLQEPALPLSLSLRFGGSFGEEKPFAYLDNLLPDNLEVRERLAGISGVGNDTFSLLSVLGEDVAGRFSLSPDPLMPERDPVPVLAATEDDIAYRIATLRRDPAAPPARAIVPRWSLAGQQAKFSLARVGNEWFWSTFEVPSTHILKPTSNAYPGADLAEKACLDLAGQLGLPASESEILEFRGERVFAVKRWDRAGGLRLHAEDLVQSLGLPTYDKYSVAAQDVIGVLREYGQVWEFVRQLAFNTAIGNFDAHGKNYSVLLFAADTVRLAPIYDALPIFLWPKVRQLYAMDIGGQFSPERFRESDWVVLAERAGLDASRLLDEIRPVFAGVQELLPDAIQEAGLPGEAVDAAGRFVKPLAQTRAG
ncbi:MAG: HipA domain-containing protein [Propionibacteriaceae bacterium]|jgi:serine/threonine-protein kinase HipA|nr:HipA domain-containing protein [Propionibacteriaceae bacterium]